MIELIIDVLVLLIGLTALAAGSFVAYRSPEAISFGQEEEEPLPFSTYQGPVLDFERAFVRDRHGHPCLQLVIKNLGGPLTFEGVEPHRNSALQVEYLPQQEEAAGTPPGEEVYPRYTSLSFFLYGASLQGPGLQAATYDFSLRFRDQQGHVFRQRITGRSEQPSILEPVITQNAPNLA